MSVGATVISAYPERKEALCDAGAIAMSKDVGPISGYGPLNYPAELKGWSLGRTSQEHGILVAPETGTSSQLPRIGTFVQITPQHACLTAAQHPWFLIVDGSEEVVDIWVPCKGW
jgi:D-serine deaminase-like pyridoxal phosphate-dependent protein